ncbi:hypothetical protein O9992_15915 [Vibrio lentus]|nr:hypothetical protein [Vibrio lentus]
MVKCVSMRLKHHSGRAFDGDNDQKQAHDLNEELDIEESENGSVSDPR